MAEKVDASVQLSMSVTTEEKSIAKCANDISRLMSKYLNDKGDFELVGKKSADSAVTVVKRTVKTINDILAQSKARASSGNMFAMTDQSAQSLIQTLTQISQIKASVTSVYTNLSQSGSEMGQQFAKLSSATSDVLSNIMLLRKHCEQLNEFEFGFLNWDPQPETNPSEVITKATPNVQTFSTATKQVETDLYELAGSVATASQNAQGNMHELDASVAHTHEVFNQSIQAIKTYYSVLGSNIPTQILDFLNTAYKQLTDVNNLLNPQEVLAQARGAGAEFMKHIHAVVTAKQQADKELTQMGAISAAPIVDATTQGDARAISEILLNAASTVNNLIGEFEGLSKIANSTIPNILTYFQNMTDSGAAFDTLKQQFADVQAMMANPDMWRVDNIEKFNDMVQTVCVTLRALQKARDEAAQSYHDALAGDGKNKLDSSQINDILAGQDFDKGFIRTNRIVSAELQDFGNTLRDSGLTEMPEKFARISQAIQDVLPNMTQWSEDLTKNEALSVGFAKTLAELADRFTKINSDPSQYKALGGDTILKDLNEQINKYNEALTTFQHLLDAYHKVHQVAQELGISDEALDKSLGINPSDISSTQSVLEMLGNSLEQLSVQYKNTSTVAKDAFDSMVASGQLTAEGIVIINNDEYQKAMELKALYKELTEERQNLAAYRKSEADMMAEPKRGPAGTAPAREQEAELERVRNAIAISKKEIEQLEQKIDEVAGRPVMTDEQAQEMVKLQQEYDMTATAVEHYGDMIAEVTGQIEALKTAQESASPNSAIFNDSEIIELQEQLTRLQAIFDSLVAKRDSLSQKMESLKPQDTRKADAEALQAAEELRAKQEEQKKANEELDKSFSKTYNSLTRVMRGATPLLTSVNSAFDAFATKAVESINQVINIFDQLANAPTNLADAMSNGLQIASSSVEKFGEDLAGLAVSADEDLEKTISSAGQAAMSSGNMYAMIAGFVAEELVSIVNAYQKNLASIIKITTAYISGVAKVAQTLITVFKRIGAGAFKLAQNIGKAFHKKNTMSAKKLLSILLKYGLGVRSLYMLFRKLRSMITEGFKSIVTFSERTNIALSNIQSHMAQLKGQVSAAIEPVLVALEPILTRLIQLATDAALAITKFVGALTNTKKVLKATLIYKDYAASLASANKQLAGFDELNNLTSGAGAGGADDAANGWEWVDSEFPDWWEDFKAAWDTGDFTKFGRDFANKITEFLNKIPWDTIHETSEKLASSLATFINGFISADFATDLGTNLAEAFTTGIIFFKTFVEKFDFKDLGMSVAAGLRAFIENINFEDIRDGIVAGVEGIIEAFTEFGTWLNDSTEDTESTAQKIVNALTTLFTFDGTTIGTSLGEMFNAFLGDSSLWSSAGEGVNTFITNVIDFVTSAFTNIEWDTLFSNIRTAVTKLNFKDLGKKFAIALQKMFASINPIELGRTLNKVMSSVFDGVIAFLYTLKPEDIQEWLDQFLARIDVDGLLQSIFKILIRIIDLIPWDTIGDLLQQTLPKMVAIFSTVSGYLMGHIWKVIKPMLVTELKNFMMAIVKSVTEGNFITILLGILTGGISIIIQGLINWVKDKLGIHSPSTVAEDWGINLIQGFANGIISMKDTVLEKMNVIKAWVLDVFSNIRDKAIERTTAMKDKVVSVFNKLKEALKVPINGIITFINVLIQGITSGINKIINALNGLTITPPDWMIDAASALGISLGSVNFNIPTIPSYTIPALAKGAVLPPNKPFLAQLGDQKNGTNIETPLSTMMEAFNMAFAQNSSDEQMMALMQQQIQLLQIIAEKEFGITNKQIFKSVQTSAKEYKYTTGRTAFT